MNSILVTLLVSGIILLYNSRELANGCWSHHRPIHNDEIPSHLTHDELSVAPPRRSAIVLVSGDRRHAELFHKFMKRYNRTYEHGSEEYFRRFQNFLATIRRRSTVKMANFESQAEGVHQSAMYGLNQFSDLSVQEFRRLYLTLDVPKTIKSSRKVTLSPTMIRRRLRNLGYPARWDWRDKDVVTPVRNQGSCGACYAISTVSMIETMRSLKLGRLSEPLSIQQVLDCSSSTHGCGGGDPYVVLDWLNGTKHCKHHFLKDYDCQWMDKHTLAYERNYPTFYDNQYCNKRANKRGVAGIKDYSCHYWMNELDILAYVYEHGPVTVGVDSSSWQDYLGGIIQYNCNGALNHAVVIIGYDVSGPVPYYIIKNSWGTTYGHLGYVYIRAGSQVCGIQTEVCGATC